MSHQRHKKIKPHKSQSSFEYYISDPDNTPDGELVSETFVPIQ